MSHITGLTLGGFSVLQTLAGNYALAILEVLCTALLLFGAWRIEQARHLYFWIYLYLIPTFCFILYIIAMPDASAAKSVPGFTGGSGFCCSSSLSEIS